MDTPNLSYIEELSGDDIAFKNRFIKILKLEFPVEKLEYLEAIESDRMNTAADMVHKLKHKMNILSLLESYKLAVIYEEELRLKNRRLQDDFLKIMNTIEDYLKTI